MPYNEIANIYRQESAHGNHPVELVGKLFDAVLEDFRRALSAANMTDIQARTASLNHALQVIGELQSVLDHERGGEVSRRLDGFYNVTRSLVIAANTQGAPAHMQRLIDLYMPLRQAWRQVERDASIGKLNTGSPALANAGSSAASSEKAATASADTTTTQWNA
jgi:flagellar protein FliS